MAKNIKFDASDMFGDLEATSIKPVAGEAGQERKPEERSGAKNVADVTPIREVDKVREVSEVRQVPHAPVKDTASVAQTDKELSQSIEEDLLSRQGRKGEKSHKLIFSVTDEVFDYINIESRRRGISRRQLVCEIVMKYKNSPEGRAEIK